ncbi:vacuolar fusion protein CCZ1 homolog [Dermacentor silvarum]|uniref:vacuolar fusion protein CCZ1 homolog n=1 Tax=Dermacentor silvarum TaxID=543639 RepID=UPI0018984F7B|nr:vacuolar fusion protein CCZ1 homolog [Dermacentor silvarum]
MAAKTQVYLHNFFVYNPTYGKREDEEHKKIIYYYPEDAEQDVKLRNVGLCEALVNFTQTFSPSKPCEVLHTQKTRQFFLQPEENFWMVMTIGLPTQQKTRNNQLYVEHLSDDIQDHVYQAILEGVYKMFQMFGGSLSEVLADPPKKGTLKDFLDWQIPRLRVQHADLLDVFQGVQFLPLDKHAFLRVQCFVNRLEGRFGEIRSSVFLCNDLLVWSGLEQGDMQVLYQYLVHDVLQSTVESELLPGCTFAPRPATGATQCRFLYGPVDEEETLSRTQRVYVSDSLGQREQCHLLIFRAYSSTVCLLVNVSHELTVAFLKSLEGYLSTEFVALANEIGKQCTKLSSLSPLDGQSKYIYFNRMNLAQKSTVHSERRTGIVVPPELVRFLADINEDLKQIEDAGEMTAKTTTEWWVVGKVSDQREFYVVLNQKSANIIQIHDEVKRLCASQFQNIFFLD